MFGGSQSSKALSCKHERLFELGTLASSLFNLITRLGIKAFSYCTSYYAFSIFAAIFCAITISTMAATANNADPMKPMVY